MSRSDVLFGGSIVDMYDGPFIADKINPTDDEIRAWALSGAFEPMEDWDIIIAEPEHMSTLIDLVADPDCRSKPYLLQSLNCMVGHSDRSDPRILGGMRVAESSSDALLQDWASRLRRVIEQPSTFNRKEWCG